MSAGAGRGTEFTIKLPWKEQQVQEARTVTAPQHRCRSVLIIEDNVDVAESLRELLELAGHEVEVANSGHEGLALASAKPPEVLLCDIGMPGMDGFAVGRAFRSDVRLKDVFLVALTGYTQPDDVEKVKAAGFDRHLAKPVDLATLRRVLAAED
ncbi:MAG: Polar-differentiation response regulator DivK [Firmicutes bacterium ADurb.Bin506]|nr:MAG: Polar-differentiation response regulator DivK [Firmicutes bacterium ADurb.Bin506]